MKFIERPDCMPLTRGNKVIEVAPDWDKMEVAQVVEPVVARAIVAAAEQNEAYQKQAGSILDSPKLDAPKKRSKKE